LIIDEVAGYRNAIGRFQYSDTIFDGQSFGNVDNDGSGNVLLTELNAVEDVQAA